MSACMIVPAYSPGTNSSNVSPEPASAALVKGLHVGYTRRGSSQLSTRPAGRTTDKRCAVTPQSRSHLRSSVPLASPGPRMSGILGGILISRAGSVDHNDRNGACSQSRPRIISMQRTPSRRRFERLDRTSNLPLRSTRCPIHIQRIMQSSKRIEPTGIHADQVKWSLSRVFARPSMPINHGSR